MSDKERIDRAPVLGRVDEPSLGKHEADCGCCWVVDKVGLRGLLANNEWRRAQVRMARDALNMANERAERWKQRNDEKTAELERLREGVKALAEEWAAEDSSEWHYLYQPAVGRAIEAVKGALVPELRGLLDEGGGA